VPPFEERARRLAKKVEAGAEFIQTQFCFDVPRLEAFLRRARELGLHEKAAILVGVGPLRSARAAEWMASHVPGVVIPEDVLRRMRLVPSDRQQEEGKRLCIEVIQQVRQLEGVRGVHVMAYRQEELVAEIIEAAGLLPRRVSSPVGQSAGVEA
jgi:methylenetetrahydrofolate reductase (NADPH)